MAIYIKEIILKKIFFVLLLIMTIRADVVRTSSGKEINGKIISFSAIKGLVVETEYGNITITPGNLSSFLITKEHSTKFLKEKTLKQSKFYKDGFTLDSNKLKRFKVSFETKNFGRPNVLVELIDTERALFGMITREQIGVSNEEYADLSVQNTKLMVQYFVDGFKKKKTINGIEMLLRKYSAKVAGFEGTYLCAFFRHDDYNYAISTWTYKTVYKKRKNDLMNIIASVKKR